MNNELIQIVISFCIPVYNQSVLLRKCIESIIVYKGSDIEIIVNDDCSTENIKAVVEAYNDSRIKYFRNEKNVGHSLNIINSFINASGKYAFLLRTRDQVISSCLSELIQFIKNHPDCSYITGNAIEENGCTRYSYDKEIINKGVNALKAHFNLYVHPSGSLYNIDMLQLKKLQMFLEEKSYNKQSFVAHSLMRMQLAEYGDFGFFRKPMWIYIEPNVDDIAVNKAPNGVSVFDPSYMRQRYTYQLLWCKETCEERHWNYIITELYKKYLFDSSWRFFFGNINTSLKQHYNFETREFSVLQEIEHFDSYARNQIEEIFGDTYLSALNSDLKKIKMKNTLTGWGKCFVQDSLKGTSLYRVIRKIYRKSVNKRFS